MFLLLFYIDMQNIKEPESKLVVSFMLCLSFLTVIPSRLSGESHRRVIVSVLIGKFFGS